MPDATTVTIALLITGGLTLLVLGRAVAGLLKTARHRLPRREKG